MEKKKQQNKHRQYKLAVAVGWQCGRWLPYSASPVIASTQYPAEDIQLLASHSFKSRHQIGMDLEQSLRAAERLGSIIPKAQETHKKMDALSQEGTD